MYGILAACIAVMAMFLGLFALSVETDPRVHQDKLVVERVEASIDPRTVK